MEGSTWYVIKQRLAWIKMHERGRFKYLPPLRIRDRPGPLQKYLYTAIDDCTRLAGVPQP